VKKEACANGEDTLVTWKSDNSVWLVLILAHLHSGFMYWLALVFTYAVYKSLLYVLKNNYDSNYDIDWCCTHTSSLFDCVTWGHTLQYFVCCRTVLIVFLFIARAFISGGFQASYVYTPEVWYCHLHLSVLPVSYYLSASSRCIASQVVRNPISGTRFSDILNCQRKL